MVTGDAKTRGRRAGERNAAHKRWKRELLEVRDEVL
jgi:hypothetical protein